MYVTEEQFQQFVADHQDGAVCFVCGQAPKEPVEYKRPLHADMVRALIAIYKSPSEWAHLPTVYGKGGDGAKLRWWGLAESQLAAQPDNARVGYWRVTPLGRAFIRGYVRVPRHIILKDNKFQGYADEADVITIQEALGTKFNYQELIAA